MDYLTRDRALETLRAAYVDGGLLAQVAAFGPARPFLDGYVEAALHYGDFTPEDYAWAKQKWGRSLRAEVLESLACGNAIEYDTRILAALVDEGHISYQEMDEARYQGALKIISEYGPYGLYFHERRAIAQSMSQLFDLPITMRIPRRGSQALQNSAAVIKRGLLEERISFVDVLCASHSYFIKVAFNLLEKIKMPGYRISTSDRCLLYYADSTGLI